MALGIAVGVVAPGLSLVLVLNKLAVGTSSRAVVRVRLSLSAVCPQNLKKASLCLGFWTQDLSLKTVRGSGRRDSVLA